MRSLAQARRASILEGTGESSKTQKDLFDYMVQSSIGEGAAAMTDEELVCISVPSSCEYIELTGTSS